MRKKISYKFPTRKRNVNKKKKKGTKKYDNKKIKKKKKVRYVEATKILKP